MPLLDSVPHSLPAAPSTVLTNVPTALSSFVGRVREVAAVRDLLSATRLLTVIGPGGAGKTRLAREVAAGLVQRPPDAPDIADGVWWVELAPVAAAAHADSTDMGADPGSGAVGALAAALGVRADSARLPLETVAGAIGGRRMLVVLDNCEHVIADAAALAERLLRACPNLTLLATSREALAVEGEMAWAAPPLAHPPAAPRPAASADLGGAAALAGYDAVRLFVERARAARPSFGLTDDNAAAVAAICARLDGIPLALELAAPHVATLGVQQLAARLADALALLDRGRRTGPARHRTLRALLDWSYERLAPAEQRLLRQLSVLHAPVGLDAVVAVCGGGAEGATVAALGRLVEQSLVDVRDSADASGGEVRYRLLETVRQYGAERLAGTPEEAATRAAHARWMGDTADVLGEETGSAGRGRAMLRFHPLVDDARAALAWSTGPHGDPVDALRVAGGLAIFWHWAGLWAEGRAWAAAAVRAADAAAAGDPRTASDDLARPIVARFALARALQTGILLDWMLGAPGAALDGAARALPLWPSVEGDPDAGPVLAARAAQWEAYTQEFAAFAHLARGDAAAAVPLADAAVEAARRSGNGWARGLALGMRAMLAPAVGRPGDAAADLALAEAELRAVGDTWVLSWCYANAAAAALAQGDPAGAARHARLGVATLRAEPDWHYVSRGLDALAAAGAAWLTAPDGVAAPADARASVARSAATLLGAAAGVRERSGTAVWPFDADALSATAAAVRGALPPGAFDGLWSEARARPSEAAFDLAASVPVVPEAPAPGAAVPAASERDPGSAGPAVPDERAAEGAPKHAPRADAPRADALRVLALGPLVVERGGVPVGDQLPGGKATELLLYLVCHREGRTREQIGVALWPDASAAQLRNHFHVVLHALRRALGDPRWVTHADGAYRLERTTAGGASSPDPISLDCDVDAVLAAADAVRRAASRGTMLDGALLEDARRALARLRGDLGEGLVAGEWLDAAQTRVHAAWADGMAIVGQALAAANQPDEAATVFTAILERDPFREAVHRALMACYARSGEAGRALVHYDALAARLAREVGARPARETQALADTLRRS